ncbi:MAG: 4-(cytidine 5'-diphospho)-2-C-methyl-D-erythritol kinase [Acidimicrobiales bacterium]|jgi:4-diphosphocytidyl-2-C-methyl-D-erythritol kinase|nr:4-(cytidine 5'-diphospho)-2-C-methyl-D-erythritol kinase [Acidimicrobiales bacterium]|tara:strand:+ start:1249 stop:1983 length:735 start_codon:yes stop_codon:yes gene_type:complete
MTVTRLVAPAKLTLSLRVTGLRSDGYHFIDAEMVSVDLCDELLLSDGSDLVVRSAGSGLEVPVNENNLVTRALGLVGREVGVTIEKEIPAGAGLGGGSTDAAAILRWAGLDDLVAAVDLGSDVAFCLRGGRARVRGTGEILDPLPHLDQEITLLIPPIGVSTPEVYRAWDELDGPIGLHGNDLEEAAIAVEPEIAEWRDVLSEATGTRARLAGSGGTWFVEGRHETIVHRGIASRTVRTMPPMP